MIKKENGHIVVEVPSCLCQVAGASIDFCSLHEAAADLYRSCCESMHILEKVIIFWIYGRAEDVSLPTRRLAQETLHKLLQSIQSANKEKAVKNEKGE